MSPSTITPGILNLPGPTPDSKSLTEKLLKQDREKHHCFFNTAGFHNHLSHHILAAYDLGAPSTLLQAIYDEEVKILKPIDTGPSGVSSQQVVITKHNWKEFLGDQQNYASFLTFFATEIKEKGVERTFEEYLFTEGSDMLFRFVAGVFHPLIQTGYGAEFGSPALIAQGLSQTAIHTPVSSSIFPSPTPSTSPNTNPTPLLEILRKVYDSPTLKPVMPYDPNALISARVRDTLAPISGRSEEIRRLCQLWFSSSPSASEEDIKRKCEELTYLSTLLLTSTSKPNRKPRLDFFLMHILTSSLFLPSLLGLIPSPKSKIRLLKVYLPVVVLTILIRGRPRINPGLIMSHTASPRPPMLPSQIAKLEPSAIGDPTDPDSVNPWTTIISSVLHAPDSHTLKAIRALCFAAREYGTTPAGSVVGATFKAEGGETHEGMAEVDGSLFVRAAGVVMDVMGWVKEGGEVGEWDRSGLGWEGAWA